MYSRAVPMIVCVLLASASEAQVQMRPTAAPLVTAEHEEWYLAGEPVTFAGDWYYPAGAQVFFDPNEMVRSGFYLGVPLYTRSTIEPYSIVYVPVGRGLMQPYERRRAGELAGTVGSRSPSFPVAVASAEPARRLQAPAPPALPVDAEAIVAVMGERPSEAAPVGSSGVRQPTSPAYVRIGGRPSGINAIFIEYGGEKWFSTGRTIEVNPSRMVRLADYKGFPVWRASTSDSIYVGTTRTGMLAVPYSRQQQQIMR